MSKETIDLKDLDDLLCKYEVKDLEDLENRFKNVADIEAKLAEKERQLKLAEELLIKQEKEYDEQLEKQAKIHYKHLKGKDQDKISFAVEQLEKVKECLKEEIEDVKILLDPIEYEEYHELLGVGRGYKNSIEVIDNQIEELKKEMK